MIVQTMPTAPIAIVTRKAAATRRIPETTKQSPITMKTHPARRWVLVQESLLESVHGVRIPTNQLLPMRKIV